MTDSIEELLKPEFPNWPIVVFVVLAAAVVLGVFQVFFHGS